MGNVVRALYVAGLLVLTGIGVAIGVSRTTEPATLGYERAVAEPFASWLSNEGSLRKTVSTQERAAWEGASRSNGELPLVRARLLIRCAEFEYARSEPAMSRRLLDEAIRLAPKRSREAGLAAFNRALCLLAEGRYRKSYNAFVALKGERARSFDSRAAAIARRHALCCAIYHEQRAAAGITEPTHLNPVGGAASLAVVLRDHRLPFHKSSVLPKVHRTGRGSSMDQLERSARSFGLSAYCLSVPDAKLPTLLAATGVPLIAWVERDHTIVVTKASASGVTYWCSDCGPWPGGERTLSWKQWRMMDAEQYLAFAVPGSEEDQTLRALVTPDGSLKDNSLFAAIGFDVAKWTERNERRTLALAGVRPVEALTTVRNVLACKPGDMFTPLDSAVAGPYRPLRRPTDPRIMPAPQGQPWLGGPSQGDPVNLATGEEEYSPPPDITVYNPTGPSISLRRLYRSLGAMNTGFGDGWSHNYDMGVRPAVQSGSLWIGSVVFPNGSELEFTSTSAPSTSDTVVDCEISGSRLVKVQWLYNSGTPIYRVHFEGRSKFDTVSSSGDDVWRVAKLYDPAGNYITFEYNSVPRLTAIKDSSNNTLVSISHTDGYITAVTDAFASNNRTVYYLVSTYTSGSDTYRLLDKVSVIVPTGTGSPPERYDYGYENIYDGGVTRPLLTTITVPSATGTGTKTATINYYDTGTIAGMVSSTVDANGNKREYSYGSNETTVTVKNPGGTPVYAHTMLYNGDFCVTSIEDENGDEMAAYGTYGGTPLRPTSMTVRYSGSLSRTWTYAWASHGRLTSVTSPSGLVQEWTYESSDLEDSNGDFVAFSRLIEIKEGRSGGPNRTSTQLTYVSESSTTEPKGFLKEVKTPIPGQSGSSTRQTTTYTYNLSGNIWKIESPGNNAEATHLVEYGYTSDGTYSQSEKLGQPIKIIDSKGEVTHYRYDARNNVTETWDPLGNTTTFTYNIANQQLLTTLPEAESSAGHASQLNTYLYVGGPRSKIEAFGPSGGSALRTVNFAYGAEGEPLARTGSAEEVALTYTPLYQTATLEDGEGNATTYTYDLKGQLTEVAYPLADSSPYYEDRIQYTSYDRAGQLLGLTDGNNVAKTFTYGSSSADDGLLTQIAYTGYSGKTITLTYDDFNRLETVREPSGPSSADAATYEYDDLDNVVEATRTYKGLSTKTFEYGFHADGSRETMINAAGTWTYSYDENGQCVELESPAGTATFSYLDNGWQETRTLPNGSYTEYEWNNLGLPKTLTNYKSDATIRSKFETFSYDGVFNMTGMDTSSSVYAPFVGPNTWGYDTKDRLTSDAYVQDSGSSLNYSDSFAYDDAFNPTTFKGTTHGFDADNRRTSPGTFAYDGNGNPTTYNGVAMSFDLENRLTSTTSGSDVFDAGYRSDGLRAWKAWNMVAPAQEGDPIAVGTYYYYDGGLPVLEVNGSGTITAINVFAPDGLVSRKQSGNWRHYQFDAQGSVTHRLRDNDTVISNGKYTAYGSRLTVPSAMDDPFGFNGRWGYYTDLGLELILCMHRYYDVATGRWLTRDPIGYGGGINLYGYCAGRPIGSIDPDGLLTIAGDTSGWAIFAWIAPGNWPSHNGLPKDQVIDLIIKTDDDTLAIWGHGFQGGISINSTENLYESDLTHIAKERKRLGKKKFRSFVVNQCDVFSDGDILNAALQLSHSVVGYTGLNNETPRQEWTKSVPPGTRLGAPRKKNR